MTEEQLQLQPQFKFRGNLISTLEGETARLNLINSHADENTESIGKIEIRRVNKENVKRVIVPIFDKFGQKTEEIEEVEITAKAIDDGLALLPAARADVEKNRDFYEAQLKDTQKMINLCNENLSLLGEIESVMFEAKKVSATI